MDLPLLVPTREQKKKKNREKFFSIVTDCKTQIHKTQIDNDRRKGKER